MPKRIFIFTSIWTIAFVIALLSDFTISQWVHDSGTAQHVAGKWWAQIIKAPGEFPFAIAISILLLGFHQIRRKQAAFLVLASAASGLHVLIKWAVGRTRPYKLPGPIQPRPFELHPFRDGLYGLFHQTNLSFPSGHGCPAAALMTGIFLLWPQGGRGRWIFAMLAVMVGIERVAENAHYCSDVVGSFGFGILLTWLLYQRLSIWMQR